MERLRGLSNLLLSPVGSETMESEITAGMVINGERGQKLRLSDHKMNELDTESELGGGGQCKPKEYCIAGTGE
ncbi:hypothetical protein Y032_0051g2168 [Ancylostoma ceylanicum]|uniref:Uncharacterized protein n=1 Tax=Ancylostoma ceylanicum TaxID=53326 RepID=A0A016U9T1_9BILA|nr:hypothetical protein Y032_0051g2168 [Ancylostoma ceylanicum]